ncbi:hypothetical protein [Phreatobacter sp.]|uniref:hypothetical protein n=1 Tax=Phreatobacter sp. TaxID=1966341 RepID=UPI003F717450
MPRSDVPRRLSPIEALLTAIFGVGGGLFIAVFMFVQLRSAWMSGVVALGQGGDAAVGLDYESEPFSFIIAMSALFPAAIICGIALSAASIIVLVRHRGAVRRAARVSRK